MRYPRSLFAALMLVICVFLDVVVGNTSRLTPVQENMTSAPRMEQRSTKFLPKNNVTELSSADKSAKATSVLAAPSEPMPVITPPSFRTPEKIAGLLASSKASASFIELPEPQISARGLVSLNFSEANLFCAKQNKRLPSILDVARWAAHNGALVASVQDAKRLQREKEADAIYLERSAQTKTVDFYFDNSRFVYPTARPITNASIWTSDARALGSLHNARHYAFFLYEAKFSAVPETSSLSVVCLEKKSLKGTS